jgi:hypothetical protein
MEIYFLRKPRKMIQWHEQGESSNTHDALTDDALTNTPKINTNYTDVKGTEYID